MTGKQTVAKDAGLREEAVEEVFEQILRLVAEGKEVRIQGFGTFRAKKYPGRTIVSPMVNGGKPTPFPDSWTLRFKQSQSARQRLTAALAPLDDKTATKPAGAKKVGAKKKTTKKTKKKTAKKG